MNTNESQETLQAWLDDEYRFMKDNPMFLSCRYCGGEFDGNGDCSNYCEDGFCGVCSKDVSKDHTHRKNVSK